MAGFSLYDRITAQGTLSEPGGVPRPEFALPSTVNWMRALALLVEHEKVHFKSALQFYKTTSRRNFAVREENSIFEQLIFALHQVSALDAIRPISQKADVARVGIVTWYYGIYAAATAMVTAQDGSLQDDHTGTANSWDRQIASRDLVMKPFSLRSSTLIKTGADKELDTLRGSTKFHLASTPNNHVEAHGACCAYLSGSVEWWRWRVEQDVRASREFKDLGVADFRTKGARELRDRRLHGRSVCFLHQAFRYRGKANYREALFLGYGRSTERILTGYLDDLTNTLEAFVAMAGAFASRRLGRELWTDFVQDLDAKRSFSKGPSAVWT